MMILIQTSNVQPPLEDKFSDHNTPHACLNNYVTVLQRNQRFHKIFAYSCLWERTV